MHGHGGPVLKWLRAPAKPANTKIALIKRPPLDVLVDNEASLENVTRAAEKKGWNVTPKDEGEGVFRLELRK